MATELTIKDFRDGKVKFCSKFRDVRDAAFNEVERQVLGEAALPVLVVSRLLGGIEIRKYSPEDDASDAFAARREMALADARSLPLDVDMWALAWFAKEDPLDTGSPGTWISALIYERGQVRMFRVGQQVRVSFLLAWLNRLKRIGLPIILDMRLPLSDPDYEPVLPEGNLSTEALVVGLRMRSTFVRAQERLRVAGPEVDSVISGAAQQDTCDLTRYVAACVAQTRELDRDPNACDGQPDIDSTAALDTHRALGGFWLGVVGATCIPGSMRRQVREARAAVSKRAADLELFEQTPRLVEFLANFSEAAPDLVARLDPATVRLNLLKAHQDGVELFWALTARCRRERLWGDEIPASNGPLRTILDRYAEAAGGQVTFSQPRTWYAEDDDDRTDDDGVPGFAAFDVNGIEVRTSIRFHDDAESVHRAVNDSLRDQGLERHFFYVPSTDDDLGLVFERPSVVEELKGRGLLPSRVHSPWLQRALRLVDRVYFAEGEATYEAADSEGMTVGVFDGPVIRFEGEALDRVWSHKSGMARPRFRFDGFTVGETIGRKTLAVSDGGQVLWRSNGSLIGWARDLVVVRDATSINALGAKTGTASWTHALDATASPVVTVPGVLVFNHGLASLLDTGRGSTLWHGGLSLATDTGNTYLFSVSSEVFLLGEMLSRLEVRKDAVIVTWTIPAKTNPRLVAVKNGRVFLGDQSRSQVQARDILTGAEVWSQTLADQPLHVAAWREWLVLQLGRDMVLMDQETGTQLASYSAEPAAGTPLVFKDRLLVPVGGFLNVFDYC